MDPSICSSLSSTVHLMLMSASEPRDDETECPGWLTWARPGWMLKEPESMPRERFSMRRPICAVLLKKTCHSD